MLNHTGGTYFHSGMIDYPRYPISCIWENSLTLWNFKAGKSTSKLKHVRKQHISTSQCTGSTKLRRQRQVTNL